MQVKKLFSSSNGGSEGGGKSGELSVLKVVYRFLILQVLFTETAASYQCDLLSA